MELIQTIQKSYMNTNQFIEIIIGGLITFLIFLLLENYFRSYVELIKKILIKIKDFENKVDNKLNDFESYIKNGNQFQLQTIENMEERINEKLVIKNEEINFLKRELEISSNKLMRMKMKFKMELDSYKTRIVILEGKNQQNVGVVNVSNLSEFSSRTITPNVEQINIPTIELMNEPIRDKSYIKTKLNKITLAFLQKIARELKIKNYKKHSKSVLIDKLSEIEEMNIEEIEQRYTLEKLSSPICVDSNPISLSELNSNE